MSTPKGRVYYECARDGQVYATNPCFMAVSKKQFVVKSVLTQKDNTVLLLSQYGFQHLLA